jgi:hypothetical protein
MSGRFRETVPNIRRRREAEATADPARRVDYHVESVVAISVVGVCWLNLKPAETVTATDNGNERALYISHYFNFHFFL